MNHEFQSLRQRVDKLEETVKEQEEALYSLDRLVDQLRETVFLMEQNQQARDNQHPFGVNWA